MNLFMEGVVIGFAVAAPVGPIGVLCIRRTLAEVTNHREKAARMLGISLRTLQYKIKQYGIAE